MVNVLEYLRINEKYFIDHGYNIQIYEVHYNTKLAVLVNNLDKEMLISDEYNIFYANHGTIFDIRGDRSDYKKGRTTYRTYRKLLTELTEPNETLVVIVKE